MGSAFQLPCCRDGVVTVCRPRISLDYCNPNFKLTETPAFNHKPLPPALAETLPLLSAASQRGEVNSSSLQLPGRECAVLISPLLLAVKINSSHVSKTPLRPRQNRCSLDPGVTCTSYITSAPGGGKCSQDSLPSAAQGRSGSAQAQMEPGVCAGNCRECSSPKGWDLLVVPLGRAVLPAPSDGWLPGVLQGAAQGSWVSSVVFEVRYLYQMSFCQVAVHQFLEKTSGFLWH